MSKNEKEREKLAKELGIELDPEENISLETLKELSEGKEEEEGKNE